ncbi:hypothetical protein [Muricoccus radiodurans]|uniref:hypothetical protein n=1 Tax=Muricoccus radiodurans TaxID=2231721 RepID=UPI003CF14939
MSDRVNKPDGTDMRQPRQGAEYVSDLKPGAGTDAKLDKEVKDTFPASDPISPKVITGFVATPDVNEKIIEGEGKAEARNAREDLPRQG